MRVTAEFWKVNYVASSTVSMDGQYDNSCTIAPCDPVIQWECEVVGGATLLLAVIAKVN